MKYTNVISVQGRANPPSFKGEPACGGKLFYGRSVERPYTEGIVGVYSGN